jgi:long-chain acyl-CoA synthetase
MICSMGVETIGEALSLGWRGVARPGKDLQSEAVIAHCRLKLSAYKVPHSVHLIAEIPRTGSGKIIRYKLREMLNV